MLSIKGIFVRAASAYRLPLAAAIVATTFSAQSASADVGYTGYSWIGDNIHITSPHDVSGGAGQIKLTGVTGYASNTILAWCLDIYDFLQASGTYALQGQLGAPYNDNRIGGLILEGNGYIAQAQAAVGGKLTINGVQYDTADISAATQVAIWSVEYDFDALHPFVYSISSTASSADFKSLVNYLEGAAALDVSYETLFERGNQTLGTVPVPGPILGGGLPGLMLAASGLFAWSRRKRNLVAAVARSPGRAE